MKIYMDVRKISGERTGVGHYTERMYAELSKIADVTALTPVRPGFAFHAVSALRALLDRKAVYYSPESLIVPSIVGRRAALTIHDLTPLTHPQKHTRRNLVFHRFFLALAVRRAGVIFTPSLAVAKQVREKFPQWSGKINVVSEGSRFSITENDSPRENKVLYVGTIEPRKNVVTLVHAFIQADLPAWKLVLVGRTGWLDHAQQTAFDLALEHPNVEYLSYLTDEELLEQYRSSSIFTYISEAEGFGLPPLEAMSCGVPCVVSDDPALVEVVGDAAIIVERGPKLKVRTTAAIQRLAAASEERDRLRQVGYKRADMYSWRKAAHDALPHFESLLRK
jgi:glycosyltransferase involved in cell wall biosynthesis